MPHPIVCLDERLRQYLQYFRALFSRPQYEHFVTVLVALLMAQAGYTLSHLHRAVAGKKSLSSLSRFLSESPWDHQLLNQHNFDKFSRVMQPKIEEERLRLLKEGKKQNRGGRRSMPLVTGYFIGDDSTMHKPKGVKMQGLGTHHSTTQKKRIKGHSLVQSFYTILGRCVPLEPDVYRQKKVAEKEGVQFSSKIELIIQKIINFTPLPGTVTHVLLDSWYSYKKIWKAARERGFLITTGMKSNRSLRVPCLDDPQGWKWQKLDEYAASLPKDAYQLLSLPRNAERRVFVHVVDTRIKKLYRCQLIIMRESLDDPISEARYWASSDLHASPQLLLEHISTRWDIEVFFADTKALLGIDQYQLMTTTALLRYWTLCWIAYSFLEETKDMLSHHNEQETKQDTEDKVKEIDHDENQRDNHITIGQARQYVQITHQKLFLEWIYQQAFSGISADDLFASLVA